MTKTNFVESELELINLNDVEVEEIEWLWYPYIPYGKLTIVQGDPGCGKTMACLNLASMITRGEPLPFSEGREITAGVVIYQTSEDGIADTIKPRLLNANANCNNICIINEEKCPLYFDDVRIEQAIIQTKARLMILDPLSAYIGEDVNLNQAVQVRNAFRRLYRVAQRNKCAIVIVSHMNKMNGISALYRVNGSVDVSGAVRSILTVCEDKEDKDLRLIVHVKSNLAKKGDAIVYRLSDKVEWIEKREITADDYFLGSRETKQSQAEEELLIFLSDGEKPAVEVYAYLQKKGISKRTVENAKKAVGVVSKKKSTQWMWSLE